MNFHPKAIALIAGKTYRNARKILRSFGCTHSEQSKLISAAKEKGAIRCAGKRKIV